MTAARPDDRAEDADGRDQRAPVDHADGQATEDRRSEAARTDGPAPDTHDDTDGTPDGAEPDDASEASDAAASDGARGGDSSDDSSDQAGAQGSGDRPRPPERGMLVERAAARGVEPGPPPRRTGVFVDIEELRTHIGGLLRAMLGGYEVDALGNFTFTSDGARIFTTVGRGPMGPHVGVFSVLSVDVPLTAELAGFLLTTNHRLAFGAFSYEPEQKAVWLRHSLLGATLDGPELRAAVISVASTAAKVTELLRERFGGGSFAEASEERQAAVHPPEPAAEDDAVGATGYL